MGEGPPSFRRHFTCAAVLRIRRNKKAEFVYRAVTSSGPSFQKVRLSFFLCDQRPTTPEGKPSGLGSFPFARRYSGNRVFFFFLQVMRCFSSLRLPLAGYELTGQATFYHKGWVSPFGDLWIQAYLQLPKAYRCSSRPSSAPSAKASAVCPFLLNLPQSN